ncbi:cupin domain-containing protein [Methylosinus sp. H3A]|uniref:cupin domain-containing protein n=1 Tax=Methylosinus sp. H3A TaxID=2785786 RepID=UPI0018C3055B|nr:cupin domain-containing protein [Methylosinus sp. H3A]MBG0808303.1 cupin domain-containing protein [Methylosinus sp. H3A]
MRHVAFFLFGLLALAPPAAAHDASGPQVTLLSRAEIPNLPGKSLVSVLVSYPPGGKSPPHRHAASGFIYAYVLSGAMRSATDAGAAELFRAGQSWFEPPGARHVVSENASDTEPARLLAIFVVDSRETLLTLPDAGERE